MKTKCKTNLKVLEELKLAFERQIYYCSKMPKYNYSLLKQAETDVKNKLSKSLDEQDFSSRCINNPLLKIAFNEMLEIHWLLQGKTLFELEQNPEYARHYIMD